MKKVEINLKSQICKVFVGFNIFEQVISITKNFAFESQLKTLVFVIDKKILNLYGSKLFCPFTAQGFRVLVFKLKCVEKAKSFKNFARLCNFLAKNRVSRSDAIVSVGGGVVCDLAGFVASSFLRGIKLILVPTTLLSIVDACVGGKNAINLKYGKNLIGSFKQPSLVFCNLNFVSTLPKFQVSCGVAEIIKYAVLFSKDFFEFLKTCGSCFSKSELEFIVLKCLEFKKRIVELDEFDDLNQRIKLNFGHTVGHALEKIYGYRRFSHGQAVASGMAFCVMQSEKLGLTKLGELKKLKFVLKKFGLPCGFKVRSNKLFKFCLNDKKISSDGLKLVLLKEIGSCYVKKFSLSEFKKFLCI